MTASEAKQSAIQARIKAVEESLSNAINQGLFEMRIEKLTPEQVDYLKENGYKTREIIQKSGSTWDINWE